MTALILTVTVFPLVGAATARLLRLPLPPSRGATLACVFLLGVGMHGALLYALGLARIPLGVATFAALPLLSLLVLIVRRRVVQLAGAVPRTPRVAGLLFAAPLLLLFCAAAVTPTRDYDGRVTWLPKARAIAQEESIAGPFFQGRRGLNLHNHYPLLLPLDVAAVMRLGGDDRNEAGRWIYVLIPIAAFVLLRAMLCRWFGSTGAWVAVVPAWLPLLTAIDGGALSAYHDLALAAFFGAAVLYAIEALNDRSALRCAGLFAAFALMTKNEGAALAMAVLVGALFVRGWNIVLPVAVAGGMVVYWRSLVPAAYDERYELLVATLPRSIARVPEAVAAIATHAADFNEWGFFWPAVAGAVAVGAVRERSRRFAIPLVAMLLGLASYVAALTVTSWRIDELAPVAVNRLLTQLLLPATCIVALAVESLGRRAADRGGRARSAAGTVVASPRLAE